MPNAFFAQNTTVFPTALVFSCQNRQNQANSILFFTFAAQIGLISMDIKNTCFVCKKPVTLQSSQINQMVNMPVCISCMNTDSEKQAEKETLESLADGFVCGCI